MQFSHEFIKHFVPVQIHALQSQSFVPSPCLLLLNTQSKYFIQKFQIVLHPVFIQNFVSGKKKAMLYLYTPWKRTRGTNLDILNLGTREISMISLTSRPFYSHYPLNRRLEVGGGQSKSVILGGQIYFLLLNRLKFRIVQLVA
jgi:hypothetical protein